MGKLNLGITIAFITAGIGGCGSDTSDGPNGLQGAKTGGGGDGGASTGGTTGTAGSGGTDGSAGGSGAVPGGTAGAPNIDASAGPPKLDDPQVLAILQAANQGEIDQANAALTCARSPEVISFAHEMITDHGEALVRVNALIARLGSQGSPERAALVNIAKQQIVVITTDSDSGPCDKVYVDVQVEAHSTVLALIDEVLLPSAQDPAVRAEVEEEKPAVQMHLDMAHRLEAALGGKTASDGPGSCSGAKLSEGQVVKWLMVSNMGEVEDGQMVLGIATTPYARAFAQRMIVDHGAALARVQALTAKLKLTPRDSQESVDKEIAGAIDDQILSMLQPPAFDLAYVDIEVLDHVDDLDVIDEYLLPSACTPDLRAEVEAERATVALHQGIARTIEPIVRAAATP
jgi:putative membrane protein